MSLLSRNTYCLRPHVRPSLTAAPVYRTAIFPSSTGTSFSRHGPTASSRRGIHVTAAIGETIQATAFAFSWVHSNLGVPWYLAIPLLAVGVNATIRLPLQYYVANIRARRKKLDPLVMSWAQRHTYTIMGKDRNIPERIRFLRVAGALERSRRRIYKTWGLQRYKSMAPLLGIVPFVTISEALRRKCGAPLGWISQTAGIGDSSATSSLGAASSMFDPSLVEGGCLWFTDLSSADPYFGLPLICSGILVWNTWGRMPKGQIRTLLTLHPKDGIVMTRLQILLGRLMLLVPALPLLFADLPSAIFLYWASSFGLSAINESILNRVVPQNTPGLEAKEKRKPPTTRFLRSKS